MRLKHNLAAALTMIAAVGSIPAVVAAQEIAPVAVRRIADRPEVPIDPAKAYLLVEAPGMYVANFLLMPNAEERADWARQRSEALAEAVEDYPRRLERYERELELWESIRNNRRSRPRQPVVPSDETFDWPEIESRRVFTIGPQNRFRAEDGLSLWLYEVPAGDYVFYGSGMIGMHECACMGTVRFRVAAGNVTALKVANTALDGLGQPRDGHPDGSNGNDMATRTGMVVADPSPAAYDPRLPRDRVVAAEFEPVARLPNWFGGLINRIQPIPRVFTYDRGEVVDLRATP